MRVDAMVGYDFLKQGPFTIDYLSRTILFGPIDPRLETIPYVGGLPYVVVRMRRARRGAASVSGHRRARPDCV